MYNVGVATRTVTNFVEWDYGNENVTSLTACHE